MNALNYSISFIYDKALHLFLNSIIYIYILYFYFYFVSKFQKITIYDTN